MEKQIVTELRRISNRIQMLTSIFVIFLIKEFSQDADVMKAIETLRERLDDAEGDA